MLGAVHALPRDVDASLGVPPVIARDPGELGCEAVKEVLQTPRKDHDVVHVAVGRDDRGADSDSFFGWRGVRERKKKMVSLARFASERRSGTGVTVPDGTYSRESCSLEERAVVENPGGGLRNEVAAGDRLD